MAMMSFAEIFLVLALGGGLAPLPVGLPPAAPDQQLAAAAPESPLLYLGWAGTAPADPKSANRTERLLAEPEVQHFCAQFERAIVKAIQPRPEDAGETQKLLAKELPFLIKSLLTHPASIQLSKLAKGERGIELEAALIVNGGQDADKIHGSLSALENFARQQMQAGEVRDFEAGSVKLRGLPMPRGAPNVYWGRVNTYIVIVAGDDTAKRTVERLKQADAKAPAWLTAAHKALPVERPSSITHLSPKLATAIADMGGAADEVQRIIAALGLMNVSSVTTVAGLDHGGFTTQTLIAMDGPIGGVLAPFRAKGLSIADVESIPNDANVAVAARINATDLWKEMLGIIGGIDPRARQRLDRELQQAQRELGFSIEDDLLAPFGDVVTIYNSPAEGGLVITGLTAVAKVKDAKKLAETHKKLLDIMAQEFHLRDGGRPRGIQLKQMKFKDQTIYYLNPVGEDMPIAPAWCLTDKEVIFAFYPQMVKAYLAREKRPEAPTTQPVGFPGGQAQWVWKDGKSPIMVAYFDAPTLFRDVYPILQPLLTIGFGELQREGFQMDIADLPSARAIARHLSAETTAVYRTEQGILIESRGTIPVGGAAALMPAALGLGWFGVVGRPMPVEAHPALIGPPEAVEPR